MLTMTRASALSLVKGLSRRRKPPKSLLRSPRSFRVHRTPRSTIARRVQASVRASFASPGALSDLRFLGMAETQRHQECFGYVGLGEFHRGHPCVQSLKCVPAHLQCSCAGNMGLPMAQRIAAQHPLVRFATQVPEQQQLTNFRPDQGVAT